ncbi:MAG: molybdopterin-dependent oxidoreductase, partial [Candidatus Omnitrophica bacterium]|nr:molybdopterin-dependent oxidoreductase [Candidatus Omnitrophota bacterium]
MKEKIQNLFYQTEGKFTEELALSYSEKGQGYLPERLHPDGIIKTVCGFCSTGCSLDVHMRGNEAVNLVPTGDYPVNLGEACPKGWESLTPLKASDRAVIPLQRDEKGNFVTLSWHDAMTAFVDNFTKIQQRYGKDSVAFLSTGQIPTEEMVMLGSLAKFGMGMLHGDGNTRQCMATAATAYKESFGFDAPPFTYKDFEESDVIVFVGANPCIAHPIMWERVQMNRNDPEIIVIDPRKTETAMAATRHYAITPKSDLIFLYAIASILIQEGWIKKDYIKKFTRGFEDFKTHVAQYTPETASRISGIAVEDLYTLARIIHRGERVSFWWTMGVNQSYEAVRTAQAIINLTLMTGNIGRPGTGANSITGQCNAMGSRLFSNTTNLLGGHNFESPEDRKKVAKILNIDVNKIPTENSLAYDQIIEAVAAGKIKGL